MVGRNLENIVSFQKGLLLLSVALASLLILIVIPSVQKKADFEKQITEKHNIGLSNKYFSDGFSYASHGNLNEAIFLYNKALEENPKNSDALHFLGYAEYLQWFNNKKVDSGLLIAAENNIKSSLDLDPDNSWAHYNYSIVLWHSGKHDEAVKQIGILLNLNPAFKETIRNDGQFKPFKSSKEFMNLIN